jgi:hypothetical protein
MNKIRICLLCAQPLLGEILVQLLGKLEDIVLTISPQADPYALGEMERGWTDVILVAEEEACSGQGSLAARVIECFPDLPVVQVGLEQNIVRIFTSRQLPAYSTSLIQAIRSLPLEGDIDTGQTMTSYENGSEQVRKT